MEHFRDRHHVWLRSRVHGTYLHADDDGQGVSLREGRASLNAAWAVQVYHGDDMYLLLHSAAYGRYLAATNTRAPLGTAGFLGSRVAQRSRDRPEVDAIMWVPLWTGSANDVVLRDVNGRDLRANGRHIRWNKDVVSVDEFDERSRSNMRHWIVEPIPARQGVPDLPAPIKASFLENLSELVLGRAVVAARMRFIRFVLATDDGMYTDAGWYEFQFSGRSVHNLRNQMATHVDSLDIIMCVRAGRHGRLTPLVVNLPPAGNNETIEIVVVRNGTPVANRLRHPDVDAV